MLQFLLKGLLRDRHRSLFPIIIVTLGVTLTSFLFSYINGVFGDMIDSSARFQTGHVKIVTRAFDEMADQLPNDLAIVNSKDFLNTLNNDYPDYEWIPRIHFGGLFDIPDENGETKEQGPVMGLGLHLLDKNFNEIERMKIASSLVRGKLPEKAGEILISEELSQNMHVNPGDMGTLVGATANGAMAIYNFRIAGTLRFGVSGMDRGTIIVDIEDARDALDMMDMSTEILGFENNMLYDPEQITMLTASLNENFNDETDEFSLISRALIEQNGLDQYLGYAEVAGTFIVFLFIGIMAIVLWNTSLMSGIRRYGEVGVRLAIGETKFAVYKSMIWESLLIGLAGSFLGTLFGLAFSYYLQEVGLDISSMTQSSSMMMNNVIRARISPGSYYMGFIPGVAATVLGTMMAGTAIFKRQTASLFKELET